MLMTCLCLNHSLTVPFLMWVLQEWVLNKGSVYCLQETWSKRWCLWAQTDELSWQRWLSRGWGVGASGGRQSQLSTSISQSGIHEFSGKSKQKGVNVVSRFCVFLSMLAHSCPHTWCTWGKRHASVCGTIPNQAIGTKSSGVFWQL